MKKYLIAIILFASFSFAQTIPTCSDGSIQQTLVGVTGGIAIPEGTPYETYSFSLYGGQIEPCGPMPWQIDPNVAFNGAQFQTGPWVSGDYQTGTTLFGPGGQFHMYSTGNGVQQFVGCSISTPCTLDGTFTTAEIDTWIQLDGSFVYVFKGSGRGFLNAFNARPRHRLLPLMYDFEYIQTTIDRKTLLSPTGLAFTFGNVFINSDIVF